MNKKLGALWRHQMKDGKTYFTGNVEVIVGQPTKVVLFPVEQKDLPASKNGINKKPAYNIYLSEPKKEVKPNEIPVEKISTD